MKIVPVKSADATGIFDAMKTGMDNIGVTVEKCVCTNIDGACVNQGKRHGVTREIAEAVPLNVVNIWCVAYKQELTMLDIIKVSSSVVGLVEECVDFVYRFYYSSSKRRRNLK